MATVGGKNSIQSSLRLHTKCFCLRFTIFQSMKEPESGGMRMTGGRFSRCTSLGLGGSHSTSW